MKTKEFIEKANKLGYKVEQDQMATSVYNETNCCTMTTSVYNETNCCTMAMVNENYKNMVNITYASDELFDLIVAYAKTPIEERRGAIRKRIKVVSTDKNSYLHINYLSFKQEAYLGSLSDQSLTNVMTDFSPEQIEQLKGRDDIAIDWDKVCFEDTE